MEIPMEILPIDWDNHQPERVTNPRNPTLNTQKLVHGHINFGS